MRRRPGSSNREALTDRWCGQRVFLEVAAAIPRTANTVYRKFLLCSRCDSRLWGSINAYKWLETWKTLPPRINECPTLTNLLALGPSRKLRKFFRAIFLKRQAMFCFYFCVDVVQILKLVSSTQNAHDQFIVGRYLKLYLVLVQRKLHLNQIMIIHTFELRKPPVYSII